MEQKSPIYFRIGYDESIESKKGVLSSEVSLLNLIKIIKRYNLIRLEEFKIKTEISRAIKKLDLEMKKTKSSFPFFKVPKTKKRETYEKRTVGTKEKVDINLEAELREIQEKLNSLNR